MSSGCKLHHRTEKRLLLQCCQHHIPTTLQCLEGCAAWCLQDYSNELLHAMLSWDGEDHNCPGYEHILRLVTAHVSPPLASTSLPILQVLGLLSSALLPFLPLLGTTCP